MLNIISIITVLLFTGYCIFYTYQRREKLTCMAGMMVAMIVGMMSSVSLGIIIGIIFYNDLTLSTIAAVLYGIVVGYFTGKPVSLMAAMDGMLAGIMGGMMGAMLGVMLTSDPHVMILFVDIIFIFVMTVLLQFIHEETGAVQKENGVIKTRFIGSFIMLIAGIFIVGILLIISRIGFEPGKNTNIHHHSFVQPQEKLWQFRDDEWLL